MDYPIWGTTYFAGTIVFAFLAMLFVVTAHISWGLALLNAVFVRHARVTGNASLAGFLGENSGPIVLGPAVAALAAALLAATYACIAYPAVVSAVVHALLIPLVAATILVSVQACAAYAYHTVGRALSDRRRETVAWVHAAGAFGWILLTSLATSFMTTPDRWLATNNAWDAAINPTFVPSLGIGIVAGVAMGSAALMLAANLSRTISSGEATALEQLFVRPWWVLAVAVPLIPIHFMALANTYTPAALASSSALACTLGGIAATAAAAGIGLGAAAIRRMRLEAAGAIALILFMAVALGNLLIAQAGLRSPFAIAGYLYTNGIATSDAPRLSREGVLTHARWIVPPGIDLTLVPPAKRGEWVYRALCYGRYPATSPENLRLRLAGLDMDAARLIVMNIGALDVRIPPFVGTPDEADALVYYVRSSVRKEH